ncbi:hypothetical protein BDL97_14G039900 [Sphagnum fallax]|nr:hypothetical protein BDL97_14G039900 [Sphagnum fallax]
MQNEIMGSSTTGRRVVSSGAGLSSSWTCRFLRSRLLRVGSFLLGLALSFLVGLLLHRSDLSAKLEAFGLKCDNRKEIIRAVVENNLNASFVTIGLLGSVPDLSQSIWVSFTKETYFLRSDVTRISWLQRVLESDREAFERRMNASILGLDYNLKIVPRTTDTEYAPIIYASEDVGSYILADPMSLPTVKPGIENARDTGIVSVTAPDLYGGVWRMACYLAYYGESNPASLTTVDMRRQTCLGYVGVSLAVEVVFASVLSRFIDDVEMDVAAAYVPSQAYEFLPSYNCIPGAASCELFLYDPAGRAQEKSTAIVQWSYGFQNFELRCYAKQSLWLSALYSIIAWPLLMSILVILLYVLVYLILKRLESFERDKLCMEKFNDDLRAAKVAAEAADKAKSSFLATVSHEIRTPMNGVIGMTNLLMGTELNSQQLEYVKIAQASGNSLVSLINDVLDLSKIEAGKMEIESVPFDLRSVIEDVISVFEEKIQQNHIEVSALVHDSVPPCLIGDPGKLRQVLVNIVGNAMKFTKKGSIFVCVRIVASEDQSLSFPTETVASPFSGSNDPDALLMKVVPIQVKRKRRFSWSYLRRSPNDQPGVLEAALKPTEEPQIKLWQQWKDGVLGGDGYSSPALSMQFGTKESVEKWRSWQPDEVMDLKDPPNVTVAISVEDTGIGIPLDLQYRLFQPFLQADSSTSREYGGTGIGLSICKKLVELMEGHLTVSSEPGEGSVFEMTVPLSRCGTTIGRVISNTPHDRSSEHTTPEHSDSPEPKLRGLRVMIVDGHHVRREVTASYLQRLGTVVQDAECPLSVLNLLKRKDTPSFQAVIVDLQGIEHAAALQLAKAVCKAVDRKTIPVVALSFTLSTAAQQELREAGFSSTVQKPLRQTTLAVGLLQAVGAQLQTIVKKVNSKMLAGKHILVVDDNLVNRRVASLMLSQYGASICSVPSGPEAISTLKKQEQKVDLVLMDIQMPGMDGYETTRHIRQWELESCKECFIPDASNILSWRDGSGCQHCRIPIVAVTADVMKGTHDLCFEAGMDHYISKPLDQRQLRLVLERFLK